MSSSNMSLQQKLTYKEMVAIEITKCADPKYFIRRYCQIQHPQRGRILFDLYPYQSDAIDTLKSEDYTIILKARQIGISTVVACYALWLMLFHKDKNILIIATKQDTAKNLITKVRFAYDNLPIWLQVPFTEHNKLSLRFKNGSQIKAVSSASDSARSEAVSLLVLDECAFIKNAEELWSSAQATLATGGSAILISTPNGLGGFFHAKWAEAEEHKDKRTPGTFYPIKLDWRVHPERNQAWRDKEGIAQGEIKARQEYDAEFIGSGNTVFDSDLVQWYKKTHQIDPILKMGPGGDIWIWEQASHIKQYVISADVARGETADTGDYSTFHILDAETCTQVAEYKGRINTTEFAHTLIYMATMYNNALLVVENANVGWAVIQAIIDRGYANLFYMKDDIHYLDDRVVNNKIWRQDKKAIAGFTTSTRTRPLIISKLDEYMRNRQLIIHSSRTLSEMDTFIWENSKPQAMDGFHDDLIMALAIALWIRDTSLKLYQQGIETTKLALDKFTRTTQHDAIYGAGGGMPDPYKIPMGTNGAMEDVRWLL